MLQQLRGALRNSKILTALLAVLAIAAFAVVGMVDQNVFSGGRAPLKVGDKVYSASDIDRTFRRRLDAAAADSGDYVSPTGPRGRQVFRETVATLIATGALAEDARRLGLGVDDASLREYVTEATGLANPITGELDQETLLSALARNGFTLREFDEIFRGDLLRSQITDALLAPAPAPRMLASALVKRQAEKRAIDYVVLTPDLAGEIPEPTDDELRARYERDKASLYSRPEYRRIALALLTPDAFRDAAAIDEEAVRTIYEANKARFEQPERRATRRITLPDAAAAEAAVAALRAGETSFEDLAERYDRPVSSVSFGEQTRAEIADPAVAEAVFAAGEGEILDPVAGLFGAVVVEITSVTPASERSFEEARGDIEEDLLRDRTQDALFDAVDRIETERDGGADLVEAARTAGVDLIEPEPFDRFGLDASGAEAGLAPAVAAAAFATPVGADTGFERLPDDGGEFALQVLAVEAREPIPFEDVRDEVLQAEKDARLDRALRDVADDLRAALDGAGDLAGAAATVSRAPTRVTLAVSETNEIFDAALLNRLFNAEPGEPLIGPAARGRSLVFAVVEAVYVPPSAPDGQVSALQEILGRSVFGELSQAYLDQLQAEIGVTRNEARLDAIVGVDP